VYRDALMRRMHEDAPRYNWASNKGYGAREHRRAILEHGPHPAHRRVWVANLMQTELELTGVATAPSVTAAAGAAAATTRAAG
jgi:ribonuclease HII